MGFKQFYTENATDNAKGTLEAIIKSLGTPTEDQGKDMLKMAKGMMDYYNKEKSFSPDQAKWIFNTSKAMFK